MRKLTKDDEGRWGYGTSDNYRSPMAVAFKEVIPRTHRASMWELPVYQHLSLSVSEMRCEIARRRSRSRREETREVEVKSKSRREGKRRARHSTRIAV